jgi:hypothetical protein
VFAIAPGWGGHSLCITDAAQLDDAVAASIREGSRLMRMQERRLEPPYSSPRFNASAA